VVHSRFENLDSATQEHLIQVAAEEFAERGYEGASVNRIIARAGISKGSLYYYFDDKADLYATVVERATARMIELAGGFSMEALTSANFWSVFQGLMRDSTLYLEDNPWFMRLIRSFYRVRSVPSDAAGTGRVFDVIRRWTTDILGRGRELGTVRTDLPLDFMVEITMGMGEAGDRWIAEHWDDLSPVERDHLIDGDMALFRRLLEPEVEAPAGQGRSE